MNGIDLKEADVQSDKLKPNQYLKAKQAFIKFGE